MAQLATLLWVYLTVLGIWFWNDNGIFLRILTIASAIGVVLGTLEIVEYLYRTWNDEEAGSN
jgi:hypothetical protein